MTAGIRKLIPTTVTGSHCIYSWVWASQAEMQRGNFGALDEKDLWEDAARMAIWDMEEAGIDLITDGEISRLEFIIRLYAAFENLEPQPTILRKTGLPWYDSHPFYRTTGKLRLSAGRGLGLLREWEFARRVARHPLKITIPGPYTLALYIQPGEGYRNWGEIVWDLAELINAEAKALAAAGAPFVQIDEPLVIQECNVGGYTGDTAQAIEVINRTIADVPAEIGFHTCFGNHRRGPYAIRKYSTVFPAMFQVPAHQFLNEYANRMMDEIALWREWGDDRELAAGVIDIKDYYIETPEEVAERIRIALRYVAPEKLWVMPDCGLRNSPRYVAVAKLIALVNGAEIVRAELEGRRPELREGLRGGRMMDVAFRALDYLPPLRAVTDAPAMGTPRP